jgi:ElaB/YqjD/DUF883 family membrane-anchored ribosome-binding protein
MGQDPSEIRNDIEGTRARMGDTVEALGHKADVPGRAKEAVSNRLGDVRSKISGATPDSDEVKDGARHAAGVAQENPLGLAVGAAAVGFIAGMLIPSTRVEDERIGPMADDVKAKVKETGQEALERGKEVAREAASSTAEAAREHGQDLAASAKQRSQEVRDQVR